MTMCWCMYLASLLVNKFNDRSIGWLARKLNGRLVGWLIGRLNDRSIGWLVGWLGGVCLDTRLSPNR